MNTDGHGWNRGFWRSKNVHQTMGWLRGPISDLPQLHPCESVSIRGFFCIVSDKWNKTTGLATTVNRTFLSSQLSS